VISAYVNFHSQPQSLPIRLRLPITIYTDRSPKTQLQAWSPSSRRRRAPRSAASTRLNRGIAPAWRHRGLHIPAPGGGASRLTSQHPSPLTKQPHPLEQVHTTNHTTSSVATGGSCGSADLYGSLREAPSERGPFTHHMRLPVQEFHCHGRLHRRFQSYFNAQLD